jgi:hypothetical protein
MEMNSPVNASRSEEPPGDALELQLLPLPSFFDVTR